MAKTATAIEFDGRVEQIGDRLIVRLPDEASAQLSSRGQVAAAVIVGGHSAQTVVEPDGRRGHWLPVDEVAGVVAGDDVPVRIEPTKEWPEPVKPDDFAAALDDAPDIGDLWREITPMARWEWVRWINATKNPDTRQRRIDVAVDKLRSGKRRPCCFDLSSCTDPEVAKSGKLVEA
ncbi:hypothetical protein GOARA_061_01650 [Gordonia araii NBRC 100433]|uniref:DUF1905 domain-containing protein n=1 Tax=Gordonia araii NBRC 100433 TaxID=1073574 RepID=G7H4F0_9ACTN|nr:YdeI/OmpD-associated family protein [Gordonia araii]NNG96218.1 DUF1905 domain-containing protein [Gordonia araii NBRC 100433]GAB10725.1 hypothetical protein GOARA_061_01650 [Gordonia araii NBRC 100433]